MLLNVLLTAWRICIFRAGPQDLPAATQAVAHAVMLAVVVQALQFQLSLPLLPAIAQSVVAVIVVWAFTTGVLNMRGKPERAPQTASALLLTNAIFSLLLVPFLLPMIPAMEAVAQDPEAQVDVPALSLLGTVALSAWSIAVSVWVFRNAMDARNALAIACALGMAAAVYIVAGGVGMMLAPQA